MLVQSWLAWGVLTAHLLCATLIVAEMPTFEERGCTEAVVPTGLDTAIAGRPFFFNYASPIARTLAVIDLPALMAGSVATKIVTGAHHFRSFNENEISWIRAFIFFVTTSLQWYLFFAIWRLPWRVLRVQRLFL